MPATGDRIEVAASPFPYALDPAHTALVVIDMQRDFVEPRGFGETLGNDLAPAATTVAALIALFREKHWPILHTRESHKADLSDCPPAKRLRACAWRDRHRQVWQGLFYATEVGDILTKRGITHLVPAGVTTEVCVQTSTREANDRGYECLLIEDATASYFPHFKAATLEMIRAHGAIVGWTTPLDALSKAVG
jgi:biuret amidohydrolase